MDNYQAVYDAVRSRFSHFNGDNLTQEIVRQFDFSYQSEMIKDQFMQTAYEMARPSMILKPALSIDGKLWCALLGENLQEGHAGFGESPAAAYLDFDKSWTEKLGKDKS